MATLSIELSAEEVRALVAREIQRLLGTIAVDPKNVTIEAAPPTGNTWLNASIRVRYVASPSVLGRG